MAGLLFPLAMLAILYVFLILPQRKKQKAAADLLASLGPGDEVLTTGGIYGGITEIDGDDVYLEIAPDIEIKVTRRAIASRVQVTSSPAPAQASSPASEGSEPDPDLGDIGKDKKNNKK